MQRRNNTHYQTRARIEELLKKSGIHPGSWARSAHLQRGEAEEGGSFNWVLTSEKPTTIFDWDRWELVDEVLVADGMRIPANGQVVLLDSHSRYSVKDVLGHVRNFDECRAGDYLARSGQVFFADDADSQAARAKVEGGHITDGSVGYVPVPGRSIWVPDGEQAAIDGRLFEGPVKVTREWILKEFSITPIGADVLAKVRLLCAS
jgi:hypothetical protein